MYKIQMLRKTGVTQAEWQDWEGYGNEFESVGVAQAVVDAFLADEPETTPEMYRIVSR